LLPAHEQRHRLLQRALLLTSRRKQGGSLPQKFRWHRLVVLMQRLGCQELIRAVVCRCSITAAKHQVIRSDRLTTPSETTRIRKNQRHSRIDHRSL
jgi:hypothetical protein